ncbi:biogenesis of lysosome-related organelles complex 1 subunit 4-like [Halichondria panicea]|uniref:biogenesis of lysosome-related organelles complex 1 subunit 4-like n=1 Tax=Halichondria panicea TaxID=6063 RepID=UPI00312BAE25
MADPSEQSEVPHSDGEETMDTSEPPAATTSPPASAPETEEERDMSGDEDGGVDSGGEEEEGVDLKKMAEDYASYLVINSKQDTQQLDERIENVVFRVEEFKAQLAHMHTNISSTSDKMRHLHDNSEQLKTLYTRIDQVEAFVSLVGHNVDQMEEAISKAEKELDPSKLRKMFSAFRRSKPEPTPTWQPPRVFRTRDYFTSSSASLSATPPPLGGQRSSSPGELVNEHATVT